MRVFEYELRVEHVLLYKATILQGLVQVCNFFIFFRKVDRIILIVDIVCIGVLEGLDLWVENQDHFINFYQFYSNKL